mgnify:CR=1 FL=1
MKEEYTIKRFVNGKEVKELTPELKRQLTLAAIKAIGAKEKKAR